MKNFGFVFLISGMLVAGIPAKAQQSASPEAVQLRVYNNALSLQDLGTAVQALHYLIAADSVKYGKYADTLAILYTQLGAYQPAYVLASRLLEQKGYSEWRMQVKAVSAKNLNAPIDAINAYSELFNKTNKPVYGMELLQLEYAIRRLGEAVGTGNKLLQVLPANDSTKVRMARLNQNAMQWVPMRASIHNILGLSYLDLQDKTNAVLQFEAALKEDPEFDQAKNNLNVAKSVSAGTDTKP